MGRGSFPTNQLNNQQENSDGIQLEASSYSYISVGDTWTYTQYTQVGMYVSYEVVSITPTEVQANQYLNGIFQTLGPLTGTGQVVNDTTLAYLISTYGTWYEVYAGRNLTVTGIMFYVVDTGTGIVVKMMHDTLISWEIPKVLRTPPVLQPITPNPANSSVILLEWNDIDCATVYYIYRSNTPITSTVGMTAIGSSTLLNYTDTVSVSGEYFYAVVAGNMLYKSTKSNCESVVVEIPGLIPGFEIILIIIGLTAITTIYLFIQQNKIRFKS